MKLWTTDFRKPAFHPLLKPDEEEAYGCHCTCCDSCKTVVIDKSSRRGWLVQCQDCGAMWYVEAEKK